MLKNQSNAFSYSVNNYFSLRWNHEINPFSSFEMHWKSWGMKECSKALVLPHRIKLRVGRKKKHWLRLKCIEYFKNRFQSCPYLFTPYMLGTKWKKKVVYCTFHKCFSISYNLKLLECRCLEISINFLFSRFSCKHQWQQWFLVVISFY